MAKKNFSYWVSFPQKIVKVHIVRRGTGGRRLRNPVEKPITIEDEDGNQFVIDDSKIYDDPIAATEASIKMASCLGVPPMVEVPDEDADEDGEEDLDEDEGEDLEEDDDSDEDEEE